MPRKAIFLDRDGVINKAHVIDGKPYPPKNINEIKLTTNIKNILSQLKAKGYLLIVVSNQPDVVRGTTSRAAVEKINSLLQKRLPLDDFFICYHDDAHECHCRKPQPGLIIQAQQKYNIDLKKSFMIGDRWRDTEAGQAAGCKTIFVDYGYNEKQPSSSDYILKNISELNELMLVF